MEAQTNKIPLALFTAYGFDPIAVNVELLGSGLINKTWKLLADDNAYILQRLNENVFQEPEHIAHNIHAIACYLKDYHPDYYFVAPVCSIAGKELVYLKGYGYYRLFPFVKAAHSIDVVQTSDQAYEAALQFGRFTRLLSSFNVNGLKTTIPHFHDLNLRYQQFLTALAQGNKDRIQEAAPLIKELQCNAALVEQYNRILSDPNFHVRVTHHDTKISNVLFDASDKGVCVIDLDTVMPGYFISDVGDMLRTYLSPVNEEEKDFEKITVREDFYTAIVKGYSAEMGPLLTNEEKKAFFYAGTFMIYMQALRFLTDYLNNDVYYGARYPKHNLVRGQNQAILLRRLQEKEERLSK